MPKILDLSGKSSRLEGVHLIVGEGLCSNVYVLDVDEAVLVDAGVGNRLNPLWPQLEKIGVEAEGVRGVVLTHAHHDHVGGVFRLLERAAPRVYIHRLDARHIATYVEGLIEVEEGDVVETSLWPLRVLWTPGHTGGSICLYAEEEGILFSGDTVFPWGYYGRYDGETGGYEEMVESLGRLTELEVEVLLPGHGSPVYEEAHRHIAMAYENARSNP
ncbi:MAG: Zn-dependent hydrolase, glyoxylase [Candidatus Bathyarchaeota archaeon B23]|nr:MAG: Zn-dependent hydrolase, glyoxylase [Candidatus Bathyarchaeota archaeon B23]